MASHTAVSVDDDFPAGQSAIALWAADDKTSCGIDVINRILVEIVGGNDGPDNPVDNGFPEFIVLDVGAVLGRDNDILEL